ncbi:MAG: SH3 domain-containing protein [Spirulinaceae cyanobacterium RM2_2_10]|nr:SH3 domain-containing protein [Spirulinaceae cyanobacterium SM2_1_0]NJO20331.1 SH3 domain-containing protein [Spirulinaceae cyanobacterium RM2_2_10]
MDALAYIQGYAAREEAEGIEYDLSELQLFRHGRWRNLASFTWLSLISTALLLSILSVASPAAAQMLTQGMRGEAVAEVQTMLRNNGYAIRYGADGGGRGVFGPQTEAAVRDFQAKHGLPVDGIVGPKTMAVLSGTGGSKPVTTLPATTLPQSTGNLRVGSTGDRVATVQTMLRNRGYTISYGADGSNRGRFEQQTLQAVNAFQRDAGLVVDGIVGPRTMAALESSEPMTASTPVPATGGPVQVAAASLPVANSIGLYRVNSGISALNVRSGPGTRFPVVGRLSGGTTVSVSALPNQFWAQIGPGEYVSRGFITPR